MTKSFFDQPFIPVFAPWIDESDVEKVSSVLRRSEISGTSPVISEFESAIAELAGTKFAVAVANGSVALDLALEVLNLTVGDEVILPSFTIVSCLNAILRTGATPVFVDCDPETWNMKIDQVAEMITPKTKAIMAVHIYGLPCEIEELSKLAENHGLFLIEDCAEAHGQKVNGKNIGSFGTLSTFSFYANKHVTTGEGGAVCTDNPQLLEKLRSLRNLAFIPSQRFVHFEQGWNYRLGGLQAALGLSQLKKLPTIIASKQQQAKKYDELLAGIDQITLPLNSHSGIDNHYWVYGIVFKDETTTSQVTKELSEGKIETRPFFWPLHEQPLLKNLTYLAHRDLSVSSRLARCGLYLPTGSHITPEIQERIVELIKKAI